MSSSAVASGARGGAVTLFGQVIKIGINAASVIVLSRLLSPEAFGLVAMVTILVTLGELFRDFGLSPAALRIPDLSRQQASNLFWINSLLGLTAAAVITCATPLVVLFFHEPRLAAITPALAVSLFFNGVQAQIQVHLSRTQRYTVLTVTDVLSRVVGLAVAVAAALGGLEYWALVWQTLSAALFLLMSRAVLAKWVPLRPRRGAETKALVVSGVDFSLGSLLQVLANNADALMLGSLHGAAPLGLYNRAYQLLTMPVGQMLGPLVNVVVPTLNLAKKEGGNVERYLLRLQPLAGMASTWVFSMAVASAAALIPFVLGSEWTESVLLFQILAIGGIGQAFYQVSYWGFLVEGTSREILKFQIATKVMTIILVVIGGFISVEAVAAAVSLSLFLTWPISLEWLHRTAGLNVRPFLSNGVRIIVIGVISTAVTMAVPLTQMIGSQFLLIVAQMLLALVLNLGLTAAFPKGRQDLVAARYALMKMIGRA